MSAEEIARILEALSGMNARLENVENQSQENGQAIAALTATVQGLAELVNKRSPFWTFVFSAAAGYGKLVMDNAVTKSISLGLWTLILGVLIVSGANKIGLDTDGALGEVNSIAETTRSLMGPPHAVTGVR